MLPFAFSKPARAAALAAMIPALALSAPPAQAAVPSHGAAPAQVVFVDDVQAQWDRRYDRRYRERDGRRYHRDVRYDRDDRYDRYDRDDRYDRRYSDYRGDRVRRDTRVWRGRDGRYHCRRDNGTTGLLIGGAVGVLAGREIAGRDGDRTLGAILGGAGGALLGREIDRGGSRCR